jgi:ABC-type ATPase involved in cell division
MHESIIIRNFGPVKDIEIRPISPFTVFIGESGSGKSTIMKLLVLFRYLFKMVNIRSYLKHSKISQSPFRLRFDSYLKQNGLGAYLKENTEIIYENGEIEISFKNKKLNTNAIISKDKLSLEKLCFVADKRNLIPDLLTAKRFDVMSFYLNETYTDFLIASKSISELNIDYLGIKYVSKKTNFGIKHYIENSHSDENFSIKFEESSSGMQTVVPLSVIIDYFSRHYNFKERFNEMIFKYLSQTDKLKDFRSEQNIGSIQRKHIHIHIEEPELSLYPESQRNLINFIVNRCLVEKHNDYQMTVMLATHSPYIINHLNLLIKAYDQNRQFEGASLAYESLSVYQVESGKINDLKIQKERLVNTNPLSDTINDIYDEYDRL